MANLGTIGTDASQIGYGKIQAFPGMYGIQMIGNAGGMYVIGLTKDTTQGSPSQPSMRVTNGHRRHFLWPVLAGTRTISIDVKYSPNVSGSRPALVIRANTDIGVNADIVTQAPSGSGFVTIGPVSVTVSAEGVLEVEMRFDTMLQTVQVANWDNVAVT